MEVLWSFRALQRRVASADLRFGAPGLRRAQSDSRCPMLTDSRMHAFLSQSQEAIYDLSLKRSRHPEDCSDGKKPTAKDSYKILLKDNS